ncbi:hypothetical protein [Photobacterium swingsii]|uniref:hypothetical protein n=1 Tax=Photobacterium swingsii TaxID=680026 RepID=UPI0040693CEB
MKTKLTLLACLLAAPLAQAEIAIVGYDKTVGNYAYFSNEPLFSTRGDNAYAFVNYFNEGWTVLKDGTQRKTAAYVMAAGNTQWTTVNQGGFTFQYRLAYMGVKLSDKKEDKYIQGKLSSTGCAARTKDGVEEGDAGWVFGRANSNNQKHQFHRYESIAKNNNSNYYIACNPAYASQREGDKSANVINSAIAFELRIDRRLAAKLPPSITIPASSHRVQRYATETDTAMLAGRDVTFEIDKNRYPLVFEVARTPQSDIEIKYNKIKHAGKTITEETKFKIDMMIGGWWEGHVAITPTCRGDKHLCDSISNVAIQSLAAHWNTVFHDTKIGKTVKLLNQSPSVQVNGQDWKIKVDFSNLDRIPHNVSKRSAQIHYNIEASI